MSPEIFLAIAEHLAAEPGTRRIFLVEEFEAPNERGVIAYAHSFGDEYDERDFVAERELEHELDARRLREEERDAADGMKLIAELLRIPARG